MPIKEDLLYQLVGDKIRKAREGCSPHRSQSKLAKDLGRSRTSIVNIEAGRQHASLHVLWQIADKLDIDLSTLLPTRGEYRAGKEPLKLEAAVVAQIEAH